MTSKNPNAQALGRLGGMTGGKSKSEAKKKAARENIKKATAARLKKLSTQEEPIIEKEA